MLVLMPPESNVPQPYDGKTKISILDALLDTVFAPPAQAAFDIRLAACEGITAYFKSNSQIQLGFLSYIIQGFNRHDDDSNLLTILVEGGTGRAKDPYRMRFAAVLVLHLIWDNSLAKTTLMNVSEGDADNGEEVVTCIQLIAGSLVASIERDEDWRVIIAYFMLLCTWLFEDAAAVNDFLEEGSLLQTLIQRVSMPTGSVLVKGLAATLIGILYHFSTKDSPIPRRSLKEHLTASMGRDNYLRALFNLRQHRAIREYGVPQREDAAPTAWGELPPEAYFDATFVDFLNDSFSMLNRALDRDPDGEAAEENAVNAQAEAEGRVLELEGSVAEMRKQLADLELSRAEAERHRRAAEEGLERKAAELEQSRAISERQRRAAEEALQKRLEELERSKALAERERRATEDALRKKLVELEHAKATAEKERAATDATLKRRLAELESAKSTAEREHIAAGEALKKRVASLEQAKAAAERRQKDAEEALKKRLAELERANTEAEKERKEAEEACTDAQSNVEALMTVLENSEDRRRKQKVSFSTTISTLLTGLETAKRPRRGGV
jgi:intracellular protein transport protein USO1